MAAKFKASEVALDKLCESVSYSGRSLEFARNTRVDITRLLLGSHWERDGGSIADRPLNLLSLYVETMIRTLAPKHPKALYSTFDRSIQPKIEVAEVSLNRLLDRLKMAALLQRWALDALISYGVMKVGIANPGESVMTGGVVKPGGIFARLIDIDDHRFDPVARSFEELAWEGHRYRVPLETVRDSKLYSKDRKTLTETELRDYNAEGDERIGVLGRGQWGPDGEFEKMVDLWEIRDNRRNLVYTFKDDGGKPGLGPDKEPLLVQPYVGPYCGHYIHLGFGPVPGNARPKSPIMDLVDMDIASNDILRKLIRQCAREKTVLPVRGGNDEDVRRLTETPNGFPYRSDGEPPVPVTYNQPSQQLFTMLMAIKDLFSYKGGNLELLGGRGAQSKTATQDKLLNENAGVGVADMQETMLVAVREVYRAIGWYDWMNPFHTMQVDMELPGFPNVKIPRDPVTPEERHAIPFDMLDIDVDPYSAQGQTPQQKNAMLSATVAEMMPMMPLLQQQGIGFNVNEYMTLKAKFIDLPEMARIFTVIEKPPPEAAPEGPPGLSGPNGGEYVRTNVSERSPQGRDQALVEAMSGTDMGGDPRAAAMGAA